MKKVLSKNEWVLWLLTLTPSFVLYWLWDNIPAIIPTHYNLYGKADDWGEKSMLQWLIPGLSIFMYALLIIIPLIDPKNRLSEMGGKYFSLRFALLGLICYILIMIVYTSSGHEKKFLSMLLPALALFLMILGNYLQAIKPNYFIGIRTPWTLQDENNWQRTHRFGGRLYLVGGLFLFLLSLAANSDMLNAIFLGLLLLIVITPVFYSFYLFTALKK